jgi:hypothetical protein
VEWNGSGELFLSLPVHAPEAIREFGAATTTLWIVGDDWRDSHFEQLKSFTQLQTLHVCQCDRISDSALVEIAKCRSLRRLDLIALGEAAIKRLTPVGFRHLAKLTDLELLDLPGLLVYTFKKNSPIGLAIADLQQRLPMCVIKGAP